MTQTLGGYVLRVDVWTGVALGSGPGKDEGDGERKSGSGLGLDTQTLGNAVRVVEVGRHEGGLEDLLLG